MMPRVRGFTVVGLDQPRSMRSTSSRARAKADVAAGYGALRTCDTAPVCEIAKSSTSLPSRSTACARTPEWNELSMDDRGREGTYWEAART